MTELMVGVLVLVGAAALGFFFIYNRLIALRNRFRNAWAQIDVQLKRRHDLIPNLVETARAYLAHESATLEAVIAARSGAETARARAATDPGQGQAVDRVAGAEGLLSGALRGFYAVAENYPDLKADATLARLSEELATTENRIAFARQAYNDAVMGYNTSREVFPNLLVAGPMGFRPAAFFEERAPDAREPVAVRF